MLGATSVPVRFRLDQVLEERSITQTELSRRSGLSLVTVNAIKQNRTRQVSLDTLDKLCEALEIAPGELLERESPKRRRSKGGT